ncbi:MAG: transposase [Gammaproteobacteria bacterium]|nr:MAG: transposase [Gammaproteobacteria bacterium]
MRANQDTFPVGAMCRLLKVSTSGFYDWRDRLLSKHDRQDVELAALIHASYERSHYTYGARRVHAELREGYGVRVGRKRVARLALGARSGGAELRRRSAGRAVGCGCDLCADGGGLSVPGGRARCVLAFDRRVGDGRSAAK